MKALLFSLIGIFLLTGCNTEIRRAKKGTEKIRKLQTKFPELFAESRDTVIYLDTLLFITDIPILDTVVVTKSDTITVENERIKTVVQIVREQIPVYRIRTEVKNDTFTLIERDTIITVQKEVVNQVKTVKRVPWYLTLIIVGLLIGLIISLIAD